MKKLLENKKAVAYARYSSEMQRTESIDAQLRAIKTFCEQQNLDLVNSYIDEGFSARTDKRPSFLDMIEDAKEGKFDVIVVHKLDRFARNRYDFAVYRSILQKAGVTLCSVVENFDDSPEGEIMQSMIEAFAEYYSRNLGREVMKGLKENAYNGKHTGGYVPFGYKALPDKSISVDEFEADAVRWIFNSIIDGKSYREIAESLNAHNVLTRTGTEFKKTSIYEILRNRKYIGECIYNKRASKVNGSTSSRKFKDESQWIVKYDVFPAIVEKDVFDQVQSIMHRRAVGNRSKNTCYLLKGKVFCGLCGTSYAGNRRVSGKYKGFYNYYYSCNRPKKLDKCPNKSIPKDALEAFVLEKIADYVYDDRVIPSIVEAYNSYLNQRNTKEKLRIKNLKSEISRTEAKINNIIELLTETKSKSLMTKLEELEVTRDRLKKEMNDLSDKVGDTHVDEESLRKSFAAIRAAIKSGHLDNIRKLIDTFVYRIEVFPDRVELKLNFYPDKVKYKTKGDDAEAPSPDLINNEIPDICFSSNEIIDIKKSSYPKGEDILNAAYSPQNRK